MKQNLRFKDVFLDDQEDSYGYSSLEKFIKRNRERKETKLLKKKRTNNSKNRVKRPGGRKISNRFAVIDPNSYEVIRFFDNITQLENYTGIKQIYGRIHRYENYNLNARVSPNISGYIIVRWTDSEVLSMDRDKFIEFIQARVKGWMIFNQFDRIRENIKSFDDYTLDKLFNYLNKVENINSKNLLKND